MRLKAPKGIPLLIGSMPHQDTHTPLKHILEVVPQAPLWPQLPKRSWKEDFIVQYSETLPGIEFYHENETIRINRTAETFAESITAFYAAAFEAEEKNDYSAFHISADAAAGLKAAIETFSAMEEKLPYIKIQTTGPISHGLTLKDDQGRPIFYDDDYRDILIRNCIMKCLWQAETVAPYCDRTICFIDEASLASYGSSAYIGVTRDVVVDTLSQVVSALKERDIISGIHVCGNTEWNMLIDAGFDILNPDAFEYGDNFLLYSDDITAFLEKEGAIAWGIVPTFLYTEEITADVLMSRLNRLMDALAATGIPRELLWRQCAVTPACGLGNLPVDQAEAILSLLNRFSEAVQNRIRVM